MPFLKFFNQHLCKKISLYNISSYFCKLNIPFLKGRNPKSQGFSLNEFADTLSEFFTVSTKLPEIAIMASKYLTVSLKVL